MKGWNTKLVATLSLLGALLYSAAFASTISVYPLAADITANTRFQDIQILNTGNTTAYVSTQIYRVDHPGTPAQTFTALSDNPYQVGLIVTPNKMVIPAGQMRIIRALYIGKSAASDVVYEVKLSPVSGQLVAIGSNDKDVSAGIQLIISYGVAVFVRPTTLIPDIEATRNGTALTLKNTGNTTVQIGNCKQCPSLDQCNKVATLAATLYPGNTFHYTLPANLPVLCTREVLQNQYSQFKIN